MADILTSGSAGGDLRLERVVRFVERSGWWEGILVLSAPKSFEVHASSQPVVPASTWF